MQPPPPTPHPRGIYSPKPIGMSTWPRPEWVSGSSLRSSDPDVSWFRFTASLGERAEHHLHRVFTDKSKPVVVGGHRVNQNRGLNHFYGWKEFTGFKYTFMCSGPHAQRINPSSDQAKRRRQLQRKTTGQVACGADKQNRYEMRPRQGHRGQHGSGQDQGLSWRSCINCSGWRN